jgi:hypothetical protein
VLHHAFPQDGAQLPFEILCCVVVLDAWTDVLHAPNSDQDATRTVVFNERNLLSVEKTQRFFGPKVTSKTVKQSLLIFVVLNPVVVEAKIRLTLGLHIQSMFFAELRHFVFEQPSERDSCRRIGRVTKCRFSEVAVRRFGSAIVRMVRRAGVLERSHESYALGDAAGPFLLGKILERLSRNSFLGSVIAGLAYAFQLETCAV